MEKVFDLSLNNQMAEDRRILVADSGKKYDVSFRPALLNRKYFKRWQELQADILAKMPRFLEIKKKAVERNPLTEVEEKNVATFQKLAEDAVEVGNELIVTAMRVNGYEGFDEEELLTNFSEASLSYAIDFIMGIDNREVLKKKLTNKKGS